jgi:hypothetical protein
MRNVWLRRAAQMLAALTGLSVAVVAAAVAIGGTASAAPVGGAAVRHAGQIQTGSSEDLSDIAPGAAAAIASQLGISEATATQWLEWQDEARSLVTVAPSRLGDNFGGIWASTSSGRIEIGIASPDGVPPPQAVATAGSLLTTAGLQSAGDVVPVAHSWSDLVATQSSVTSALQAANANAVGPLESGIDTEANDVVIDVPTVAPLTLAQSLAIATLEARYGNEVTTSTTNDGIATADSASCSYPYCTAPLTGGIQISGGGFTCTGGYDAAGSGGANFLLTTGHCLHAFGGTWNTYFPNLSSHAIGSASTYYYNSSGDAGRILVTNPSGWDLSAQGGDVLQYHSGTDTVVNILYQDASGGPQNWGICQTGSAYGSTQCGIITAVNQTILESGVTVGGLDQSSICATPGDSGAPVFGGANIHTAYGIFDGSAGGCVTYYEPIGTAESLLAVSIDYD